MPVHVRHLFISPGHNYFGHHGRPAGTHATVSVERVRCRAGRGIEGDRFFDYREDYRGQITFFDFSVWNGLCAALGVSGVSPGAVRRNVVVEGIDLPALIGARFSLGGVTFEGTAESTPCYWMDQAVGPGAEAWLKGRGGLRARILTDGDLAVGPAAFTLEGGQLTLDAVLPAQAAR
jgi:MOSC domain-containing protein YiiM